MQRVQKLLSNYGYTSRREAEELIKQRKVKVNGKTVSIGDKASQDDIITVNGKELKRERRVYLMFHKPRGCVTALTDREHKTVMDFIKIKERVFPIGRLDYNTSGLLLLTNDGDFANKIMHPSNKIKKSYLVRINKPLDRRSLRQLENGVILDDGKTSPARISLLGRNLIQITIHEGRNRIIRRMLRRVGYQVRELQRVSIGHLRLDNLRPGRYRKLNRKDINRILD